MRRMLALIGLWGCDQVFGLQGREPVDAPPEIDAPPATCPAIGQTPAFVPIAHQVTAGCGELTADALRTLATALCMGEIAEGPVDGPFRSVAALAGTGTMHLDVPRLAPEGDLVVLRNWDESTLFARVRAYQRSGSTYTSSFDVTIGGRTFDTTVRFGTPSRGPVRRMFLRDVTAVLEEIEIDAEGTSWVVATYDDMQLGVDAVLQVPNLSPDGLRVTFLGRYGGTAQILYSDRASLTDRFSAARPIDGVPVIAAVDAFMTADCARVYYSFGGSLYWTERR